MTAKISLFPVGNGDMTLIELESGKRILVDMNIRDASKDDIPNAQAMLRKRLKRDAKGRLFVHAFLLGHPDQDHCRGLEKHVHLGPPEDWSKDDDKILFAEIWSSPMIFRRATKNMTLCADAKAFNKEAKRRVKLFREGSALEAGNRILVLGEDESGKTDDLQDILIKLDDVFSRINGASDSTFKARLLAPTPKDEDEDAEDKKAKNKSSVIIQFALKADGVDDACLYLTGGDAEVSIWEALWDRQKKTPENLAYDALLTPHHCSWHALSYDSWSDKGEDAEVSGKARNALSQARTGALLIASSKPIKDNEDDPPCIRAKQEYEAIAKKVAGDFKCVGEEPSEANPGVLEIDITRNGPKLRAKKSYGSTAAFTGVTGKLPHGAR